MKPEELLKLTDQELLEHAKTMKPKPIFDAFFIGFLVGIIIFGFTVGASVFFALIPLFLIYLFLKKPKQQANLQKELKARNLNETLDEV